jgi:ActR/RegA family two-component response regulator
MEWPRRGELPADCSQGAGVLLLADPAWPFQPVAYALRDLGYTSLMAGSPEEAWMQLRAGGCGVVVVCASTGTEEGLQWIFEAALTRPELRVLVILDLERCAAPAVLVWRLMQLAKATSIVKLSAPPEHIVSRIEALLNQPAPSPRTSPLDRAA